MYVSNKIQIYADALQYPRRGAVEQIPISSSIKFVRRFTVEANSCSSVVPFSLFSTSWTLIQRCSQAVPPLP